MADRLFMWILLIARLVIEPIGLSLVLDGRLSVIEIVWAVCCLAFNVALVKFDFSPRRNVYMSDMAIAIRVYFCTIVVPGVVAGVTGYASDFVTMYGTLSGIVVFVSQFVV
jgi:hypothetical protein